MQARDTRALLPELVERGLTAQLVPESLVTGQLLVELDYHQSAKVTRQGAPAGSQAIEIPSVPTVDELPALVADMRRTLNTIEREVRAFSRTGQSALADSSSALQEALASVQSLAGTLERESTGTLSAARSAAESANTAMQGANALLEPGGETATELQRAIEDLAETSARLRSVAERVDRDPAVLVRGRR
jgi:paraquat-inducible protein B